LQTEEDRLPLEMNEYPQPGLPVWQKVAPSQRNDPVLAFLIAFLIYREDDNDNHMHFE